MATAEGAVSDATAGPVSGIDRMTAFSDGVFAIVITLLVIELRVPDYQPGELFHGLIEEVPAYLAFLVSFGYIGVLWLNHHKLLRLIRGTTLSLNWINLALLLGVVVIPFPTSVLASAFSADGDHQDRRAAVALYALTAVAMSAPWLAAFSYLRRHPVLLREGVSTTDVARQRVRPLTGMALYLASAAMGWWLSPLIGVIGIIVMIIYHAVTSEGIRRHHHRWGPTPGRPPP